MRKAFLLLVLGSFVFVGCSNKYKVQVLLEHNGITCDSLGDVDSVMGYSDSFYEQLEACKASMKMDSAFRQIPYHPHNDTYVSSAKYWAEQVYKLKQKSLTSDFVHELRSHEKEMLGWKVGIAKTNLTKNAKYVIYVDENMEYILGMEALLK